MEWPRFVTYLWNDPHKSLISKFLINAIYRYCPEQTAFA